MYCHLPGAITKSSKGHSTAVSSQLLQDGGQHGKSSEFHEHRPIALFLLLWSKFFDHSNIVGNITVVGEVFCNSRGYNFDRSIACRKGQFVPELSTPIRTKHCLFHNGSGLIYSTSHQVTGWSLWEIVVISEAQHWFLLLVDWALSSGYSLASLDESKSMSPNPGVTSIPVTLVTFSWACWAMTRMAGEWSWLVST